MRLSSAYLALAAVLLCSCGGGGDPVVPPPPPPPPPAAVATITVSALPATMLAGETSTLSAVTKDAQGNTLTGRAVVWSSSSNIATVDQAGLVTAVGHGAVTITATSETKTGTAQSQVSLTLPVRRFAYAAFTGFGVAPIFSKNETGDLSTVAITANGDYTVTFRRMARADPAWRETVMISKNPENPSANPLPVEPTRCHLNSYGNAANGRDLNVLVSCYTGSGVKAGGPFEVLVFGNGVIDGRSAFLEVTDAAQTHTPAADKVFNSSGQPMSVNHLATGTYQIQIANPRAAVAENYFSTTMGGPSATCNINNWNFGNTATYFCGTSTSAGADALLLVQMIGGGRTGKRWGFAWASDPLVAAATTYTPDLTYQAMSTGGPITIRRATAPAIGSYNVTFPGFGPMTRANFALQISAYQSATTTCAGTYSGVSGIDMVIQVNCYDRYTGAGADSFFTIAVIE